MTQFIEPHYGYQLLDQGEQLANSAALRVKKSRALLLFAPKT
jgi:hypothetical protein